MTTQTINQTNTTVNKPAPFVEGLGTAFAGRLAPMLDPSKAVDTSKFAPQVANQNALSQAALQQQATASGLGSLQFGADGTVSGVGPGTGVASYQPYLDQASALSGPGAVNQFMSPFQQQVIDATKSSYSNERAGQRQSIADAAIQAGAFGGGREGVQRGVYDAQTSLGLAKLEADLRGQNFAQAQNQANTAFGQQTDLATQVPTLQQASTQQLQQLGTGQQALNQAQLDATAAANRESAYEQQQRLGFFGQQFAPLMGGMGATQQFQTAQPAPSAMQTILGTGSGIGSLLGGLFGK